MKYVAKNVFCVTNRSATGGGGALGSGGPEHEILKDIQQTDTLN